MSNENTNTPTPTTATTASVTPPASTGVATITERVASALSTSSTRVTDLVVNKFVDDEVNKRADSLIKLVNATTAFQKYFQKINRADTQTFNADGSVASQSYTKARVDEIKKAKEKLDKANRTFDQALSSGDFSKVEGVINELKVPSGKDAAPSEAAE